MSEFRSQDDAAAHLKSARLHYNTCYNELARQQREYTAMEQRPQGFTKDEDDRRTVALTKASTAERSANTALANALQAETSFLMAQGRAQPHQERRQLGRR